MIMFRGENDELRGLTLSKKATDAYIGMKEKCKIGDTIDEIIKIIEQQEIVSYCTSKGCVSFDYTDVECV